MTRAPIFDAIRAEREGKGFTATEVEQIDAILDGLGVPRTEPPTLHHIGEKGLALIKQFEGCRLDAYPDPGSGGDPWTIGYGATGPGISMGVTWTQAQCDTRLLADLRRFEDAVNKLLGNHPTTQDQFDALVSLAYNVGPENLRTSTLLRLHNEGDHQGASLQFPRWNRAAGRVMAGLTRRREAEAKLYRGEA